MTIVAVFVTVVFTAALVWSETTDSPALRWFKMVASTGFIAIALSVGAPSSTYGRIVLVALALSWMGDLLLTYRSRPAFLAGLIAFLLGHVAFVSAFWSLGVAASFALLAAIAVTLIATVVFKWLSPHVGDMKVPVVAYIVVISVMVVFAFGAYGSGASVLVPIGAVLFFISDLFVARNQFVTPDVTNRIWGLPLYYLAQILLALSTAN